MRHRISLVQNSGSCRLSPKRKRGCRRGVLLLGCFVALLLAAPAAVRAQTVIASAEKRSYVHFPFNGDLEARLNQQLKNAQGKAEFEELLKTLAALPQLDGESAKKFEELYENNPFVKSQVDDALAKHGFGKLADPATQEKLQRFLKDQQLKKLFGQLIEEGPASFYKTHLTRPEPSPSRPQQASEPPRDAPGPDAEEPDEDPLAGWLRDWMEHAEDSPLGEFLRDSPAFQRGLLDLQQSLLRQRGNGGPFASPALSRFASRLRIPEGWDLSALKDLSGRWGNLPAPSLSVPHFAGHAPSWSAPSLPSMGTGGDLGRMALWLVLILGLALLFRQVLLRFRPSPEGTVSRWRPGPWPVQPGQVSSRGELVQAFEHLSLLLLGPTARSRNHRDIAAALADADAQAFPERRQAVDELASLYEWARYSPEKESLPPEAVAAARRDLCLLAGVPQG